MATEAHWEETFALDRAVMHAITAYEEFTRLNRPVCARVLEDALTKLRQLIPNAFPTTYNED